MTPPNFGSGDGSRFPSIVVVALGRTRHAGDLLGKAGYCRHRYGNRHAKQSISARAFHAFPLLFASPARASGPITQLVTR